MSKKHTIEQSHPNFEFFFNKVAWAAIAVVVTYAATRLDKLSESVTELNKNLAVVVTQLKGVEEKSDQLNEHIKELNTRVNALEVKNGSW